MSLRTNDIVITGMGMVSSLGLDAVTSCAAARAGLTQTRVVKDFKVKEGETDELVPLPVHGVPVLLDGFTGFGRLVRLGVAALEDLMRTTPIPNDGRTACYVNLSSGFYFLEKEKKVAKETGVDGTLDGKYEMEWRQEKYQQALIPKLKHFTGISTAAGFEAVCCRDQTGFVDVIQQAFYDLQQQTVARCLVGGIDSNLDLDFLQAFHHFSVLKTPDNPDGFMPGEAGAFLMLERADVAHQRNAPILGVLRAPTQGAESFHRLAEQTPRGDVLATTISDSLKALPTPTHLPGLVIGAMNGETYRALDWGYAQLRLKATFPDMDGYAEWYPAISFGEVGAATGPVAVCMGLRAFDRGYAGTDHVLVWLTSEGGARAAFSLQHITL